MKANFSKVITFITIVEMTILLPVCILIQSWPPTAFIVCWTCFFGLFEIMNVRLKKDKRSRQSKQSNVLTEVVNAVADGKITGDNVKEAAKKAKKVKEEVTG